MSLEEPTHLRKRSWQWFVRNLLLPAGDRVFGSRMMERLRFLEEAQWWSQERLYTHRDQLLKDLIRIAYREVPFYRQLMDEAGIRPEQVQSERDLLALPIVTKELLRQNYPQRTIRPTGGKIFENRTSGSTGMNFRVAADAETVGSYRASFLLALEWTGWKIGEPHVQNGINPNRNLERRLKDVLLGCHYISAFQLDDDRLDYTLDVLDKHKIDHVWGYPVSIYLLAKRAMERGWSRSLKSVVTWGDNLFPHYKKKIELAFGKRLFDQYGCSEGIQAAAQCGQSDQYHLHSLDVIVEYLDDEYKPVPEGVAGNLVLTRLHPGPMPLIRYRVGDVGISAKSRLCECGRGYELMASIQGRDTDMILTPGGNRLIVHFFTGILEHFPEIDSFEVIQDRHGFANLKIVPAQGFTNEIISKVLSKLKETGAGDLIFEVEIVPVIPLTAGGKRRFVRSTLTRSLSDHEPIQI